MIQKVTRELLAFPEGTAPHLPGAGYGTERIFSTSTLPRTVTTAVAAYKRFLKLAPDDPSAGVIRQHLKQLKSSSALPAPTSG